jgi:hypothetical protein
MNPTIVLNLLFHALRAAPHIADEVLTAFRSHGEHPIVAEALAGARALVSVLETLAGESAAADPNAPGASLPSA